jgi:hypothetical protein
MAGTSVTTKTVVIADDTAFVRDRFHAAVENAGHQGDRRQERGRAVGAGPRRSRADRSDRRRPAAAALTRASTWSIDPQAGRRAAAGADLQRHDRERRTKSASWPRSAWPATSTIARAAHPALARPTCSRTTSTAAAACGSCWASRFNRFGNTIAAALTLNLSHGGIATRTTSPLESGAKIKVRFRMPGSKKDIDAEGKVAWSDRRVGMGILFETVDQANQAIIDNFVDAHFFSNRKA